MPDAIKLILNIKCTKSKVIVKINLKRPNHNYPTCNIVDRHLAFPVTITRYIPWVESCSRLWDLAGYSVLCRLMHKLSENFALIDTVNIFLTLCFSIILLCPLFRSGLANMRASVTWFFCFSVTYNLLANDSVLVSSTTPFTFRETYTQFRPSGESLKFIWPYWVLRLDSPGLGEDIFWVTVWSFAFIVVLCFSGFQTVIRLFRK